MPSLFALAYPLVNGHVYSFASIEIWAGGIPLPQTAFKSINYSDKLTPGVMRANGTPRKLGRTRGEQEPTGDCEMYRLAFENLKLTLGLAGEGFMESEFDIVVQYADKNQPVLTDTLVAARIIETGASNQTGTDPTVVKLGLDLMDIRWNGVSGVSKLAI